MSDKGFGYECDYCRMKIEKFIHIECAECKNIHLCVECMAQGKEVVPHKNNHDYYVLRYISESVYECSPNWSGHDELLLLEGIERYGIGNWDMISDYIGNNKHSSTECEYHYIKIYIHNDERSDNEYIKDRKIEFEQYKKTFHQDNNILNNNDNNNNNNNNSDNNGEWIYKNKKNISVFYNYVGFAQFRDEFEFEWENDAEYMLDKITFNINDTSIQRQWKLKVIELYDKILIAREFIRNYIIDKHLLSFHLYKYKKNNKKKWNNFMYDYNGNNYNNMYYGEFDEMDMNISDKDINSNDNNNDEVIMQELFNSIQPLFKFFKEPKYYEMFVKTIAKIKMYKKDYDDLLYHRHTNGIRSYDDYVKANTNNSINNSNDNSIKAVRNKIKGKSNRFADDDDDDDEYDNDIDNGSTYSEFFNNDGLMDFDDYNSVNSGLTFNTITTNGDNELVLPPTKKRKLNGNNFIAKRSDLLDRTYDKNNKNYKIYKKLNDNPSGYMLLSMPERHYCDENKLLPSQYMILKDNIMQYYFKYGYVNKDHFCKMFLGNDKLNHKDFKRIQQLLQFCAGNGWINLK